MDELKKSAGSEGGRNESIPQEDGTDLLHEIRGPVREDIISGLAGLPENVKAVPMNVEYFTGPSAQEYILFDLNRFSRFRPSCSIADFQLHADTSGERGFAGRVIICRSGQRITGMEYLMHAATLLGIAGNKSVTNTHRKLALEELKSIAGETTTVKSVRSRQVRKLTTEGMSTVSDAATGESGSPVDTAQEVPDEANASITPEREQLARERTELEKQRGDLVRERTEVDDWRKQIAEQARDLTQRGKNAQSVLGREEAVKREQDLLEEGRESLEAKFKELKVKQQKLAEREKLVQIQTEISAKPIEAGKISYWSSASKPQEPSQYLDDLLRKRGGGYYGTTIRRLLAMRGFKDPHEAAKEEPKPGAEISDDHKEAEAKAAETVKDKANPKSEETAKPGEKATTKDDTSEAQKKDEKSNPEKKAHEASPKAEKH